MKTAISFLKSKTTKAETIKLIENTDADYIHVDIMDGEFVTNKTLSINETNDLLNKTNKPLDIHLMVKHPKEYIEGLADLNAKFITIHVEIEDNISELISLIHSLGIRAGISLNPKTSVSSLFPYLGLVDNVLIMGVNPGVGGQKLIMDTTNKIKELDKIRSEYQYHYEISFDGGVNDETRKYLDGLDIIISGSFVCMSDNYQEKIDKLK